MRVNQHLIDNTAKASAALLELTQLGVAVTDLNLNGAYPAIRIDHAGELAGRPAAWSRESCDGSVRKVEKCVIVDECQVIWQEH